MDTLPNELLGLIFSYLGERFRRYIEITCKDWTFIMRKTPHIISTEIKSFSNYIGKTPIDEFDLTHIKSLLCKEEHLKNQKFWINLESLTITESAYFHLELKEVLESPNLKNLNICFRTVHDRSLKQDFMENCKRLKGRDIDINFYEPNRREKVLLKSLCGNYKYWQRQPFAYSYCCILCKTVFKNHISNICVCGMTHFDYYQSKNVVCLECVDVLIPSKKAIMCYKCKKIRIIKLKRQNKKFQRK